MEYKHLEIEKKWQDIWYTTDCFNAVDFSEKKKFYGLVEFPYPSGAGMHVGHIRAFTSIEIISRKRRMEGYNVLFPIGFDAFGLPTENYALKNKIHPRIVTDENIKVFTTQLKSAGFSFDFNRVIDTTEPNFYHWTQWIFLKLYEKGLAYRDRTFVNFCPECKVVLANEESQGGKCDRCESDVVQLEKNVWFLKISAYAEKLLQGLDKVNFLPRIKLEQENWIGKSTGAHVSFKIRDSKYELKVFTTRPDTLYGATFMVVAPEHEIIETFKNQITNLNEVAEYQLRTKTKTEFERIHMNKEKTGVEIKGIKGINPITNKEIPIFIADYVMMGYGTGAIMAVPGHDTRDYEFAKKFNIDIIEVIQGGDITKEAYTDIDNGVLIHSDIINGLNVKDAKEKMLQYLEKNKIGEATNNYKMKDWAFNRQRYWGEPIPIIHCQKCGEVMVPYEDLPIILPKTDQIYPTDTGESPLANISEFVNCKCPKCGMDAKRETDTMPQWAGSSWYYLRYIDPINENNLASMDKLNYWGQVDWYNGGMEHVTRHLIYSRFWHHFLYDQGIVPHAEPYAKRTAQGLILDPDGEKMSKSKGNVVNPTDIINEYGADTLRVHIMFIGDYEQSTPWSDNGTKGCRRFLEKVWRLFEKVDVINHEYSKDLEVLINQTIKKVSEDYEATKFNTAIAQLMVLTNEYTSKDIITRKDFETLLKLLNPVAPHITEELFGALGNKEGLVFASWPSFDENKLQDNEVLVVVQVNGKLRDKISVPLNVDDDFVKNIALKSEKVTAFITGLEVAKVIVIKNKLVNIVVK